MHDKFLLINGFSRSLEAEDISHSEAKIMMPRNGFQRPLTLIIVVLFTNYCHFGYADREQYSGPRI